MTISRRTGLTVLIAAMVALLISGCCSNCKKDFVYYFDIPGPNDCPAGYTYIEDAEIAGLEVHQGGAGVVDRSGRGGVVDRQGDVVTRFCLKNCNSGDCLINTTPASFNIIESSEKKFIVAEQACRPDPDQQNQAGLNFCDE